MKRWKHGARLASSALLMLVTIDPAMASSHRDAPLISQRPSADSTDVYAFVNPDNPDNVVLAANYIPFNAPTGGPNFYNFNDKVLYDINIDNDGDARNDITYRFAFRTAAPASNTFLYNDGPVTSLGDPNLRARQTYELEKIVYDDLGTPSTSVLASDVPVAPANVGSSSFPSYDALVQQAILSLSDMEVFAGTRDDPFFLDPSLFDAAEIRRFPGNSGGGVDGNSGFNVMSLVLEIPIEDLTANGQKPTGPTDPNAIIGVYTSAMRPAIETRQPGQPSQTSGPDIQISRLGNPLINELIIGIGEKDAFNQTPPDDLRFLPFLEFPEYGFLLASRYGFSPAFPPRNDVIDLVYRGLPNVNRPPGVVPADLLRLNTGIAPSANPNRLGVLGGDMAGFPNGRRLFDDVVDVTLRVMAGVLAPGGDFPPRNQLGDGVDANDVPFLDVFPYMASPHSGTRVQPGHPGS